MINNLQKNKIAIDLISTFFIIGLVSLFVLANYFSGFNLALWFLTMSISFTISLIYPRSGFYAIIFLTFIFERFFTLVSLSLGRSEYKLYPIDILMVGIILGITIQIIVGKIKIQFKNIDWAILLFSILSVVYFLVSVLFLNVEVALAFSSAKNYGFYSLLYFIAFFLLNSKEHFREIMKVVFAGGVGILWFVFYGFLTRHGLWSDFTPLSTEGVRTLAFTHAYYLSMVMIIALIYMAYKSDQFSRWLLIFVPFWALGIIGSMMRHLWISLFIAVIFLIMTFTNTERIRLRAYAIKYTLVSLTIAVVIVYAVTLFPGSSLYSQLSGAVGIIESRVSSIANAGEDESMIWRSEVWKEAAKLYVENPVLGIGYGKKVSVEIGAYKDFVEVRNMHNSFLVLLVQMGIVGTFLIFIVVMKIAWRTARSNFRDEFLQIIALSCLGILVLQLVAFMFQPYLEANLLGIFFWINLGVLRRLCGYR